MSSTAVLVYLRWLSGALERDRARALQSGRELARGSERVPWDWGDAPPGWPHRNNGLDR